jgi:hypothetical protein
MSRLSDDRRFAPYYYPIEKHEECFKNAAKHDWDLVGGGDLVCDYEYIRGPQFSPNWFRSFLYLAHLAQTNQYDDRIAHPFLHKGDGNWHDIRAKVRGRLHEYPRMLFKAYHNATFTRFEYVWSTKLICDKFESVLGSDYDMNCTIAVDFTPHAEHLWRMYQMEVRSNRQPATGLKALNECGIGFWNIFKVTGRICTVPDKSTFPEPEDWHSPGTDLDTRRVTWKNIALPGQNEELHYDLTADSDGRTTLKITQGDSYIVITGFPSLDFFVDAFFDHMRKNPNALKW